MSFGWIVLQGYLFVAAFGRSGGAASVLLSVCHTGLFLVDLNRGHESLNVVYKLPCRTIVQGLRNIEK